MKIFGVRALTATCVLLLSLSASAGDIPAVVKGNSGFGFDLYRKLMETEGNVFFSPYSISTALAMTYAGARGETEKEMEKVLRFPAKQDELHSAFAELQSNLNTVQKKGHVQLNVANSLWAQEEYPFLDSFIELNKKYYGAGLNLADFVTKTEEARKTINVWVEEKTRQKIMELIKPGMVNQSTTLVLCNAIYFKGNWLRQFEKKGTVDADFQVSSGNTVKAPMMNLKADLRMVEFDGFSALELPYAGEDLSMIIFLPAEAGGIAELEKNFTEDNATAWMKELSESEEEEVLVSLPKFKVTCEFELSETLSAMGMPHAFSSADFSGMTGNKDLFISKVVHKAFVDVNEEGTEASAATAVLMERAMVMMPRVFRADHPFIFMIRENSTGSMLFAGRIANPAE